MTTQALTLYAIEENLLALIDTAEMVEDDEQRLAILNEIAEANETALVKRDNVIRFLRRLSIMLDTDRAKGKVGAIDAEIDRLKAFKEQLENRRDRIEQYLVGVVEQFAPKPKKGNPRLEGSIGYLSIAKNPDRPEISEEGLVPRRFKKVTITLPAESWDVVLDAAMQQVPGMCDVVAAVERMEEKIVSSAVKKALDEGEDVPGADLKFGVNRLVVK